MFENIPLATVLVSYVAVLFALSVHEAAHAGAAGARGAVKIVFDSGPRRASAPRED